MLSQCTADKHPVVAPSVTLAEKLAADTSFVRIVTIGNDFQAITYNTLRDAQSQTVRRKANQKIQKLLTYGKRDSLVLAIKELGFNDVNQYLKSLSVLQAANKQLQVRGLFLDRIATTTVAKAWQLVSARSHFIYPPAPTLRNSQHSKVSSTVICEMCFMNNCNECNEFGGGDGGGTVFTVPSPSDGGFTCRQAADNKRQASISQEEAKLVAAVTVACGGTAFAAGELACGSTAATIVGAPISPATGTGVGCIVYVGCSAYAIYQYRLQMTII